MGTLPNLVSARPQNVTSKFSCGSGSDLRFKTIHPISPENKAKMKIMDDSMAHSSEMLAHFELPGWKSWVSGTAAVMITVLFLAAGIWKITDAPGAAVRLAQMKVPENLSLAAALLLGIVETFSAVLILAPIDADPTTSDE